MAQAVRSAGAVPAVIGLLEGRLHVGLDETAAGRLAERGRNSKAAARDLGAMVAAGRTAGTTVSATLVACRLVPGGPIPLLATGGIGGVHRGWTALPDISGDLPELAAGPVCVVCSGPKATVDVAATYEALETLGVAVWAFRTDHLPCCYSWPTQPLRAPVRLEDPAQVAAACRAQWTLGLARGALLANPPPPGTALEPAEIEAVLTRAEAAAGPGGDRTPHLLAAVDAATGGRAVTANVALLEANARLAAEVAVALARR